MADESTLATASPDTAAPAAATPAPAATGQDPASSQTPAAEAKQPDAKTVEPAKTAEPAKPAAQAPEKYEFKAPEGMKLDTDIVGEFEGIAKEFGLPQDKAQRLVDLGAKLAQKQGAQIQQTVEATQASWLEASKSDKEFGGAKLQENLAIAKKALDMNPEIRTLLNESKLGNHPEMIRWMYRVGQKLSEDKPIAAGAVPPAPTGSSIESLAARLYPDHK
jgi:hypothetical protein